MNLKDLKGKALQVLDDALQSGEQGPKQHMALEVLRLPDTAEKATDHDYRHEDDRDLSKVELDEAAKGHGKTKSKSA